MNQCDGCMAGQRVNEFGNHYDERSRVTMACQAHKYNENAMTNDHKDKPQVKRYDCTSGGSQHCYGCYTMSENELGDYVAFDDYATLSAQLSEAQARLAEIERQEPVLECYSTRHEAWRKCARPDSCTNSKRTVYAAPVAPAAQAVADDVVRDAERYRWMRDVTGEVSADALIDALEQCGEEFDKAIDAAIAASQKKEGV